MDGMTQEQPKRRGRPPLPRPPDNREELLNCAMALELAANLRSGHMDSESRAQEIQRQVRLTLQDVAARLRALSGL